MEAPPLPPLTETDPTSLVGQSGKPISPDSARRAQRRAKERARRAGKPEPVFIGLTLETVPNIERVWWSRTVDRVAQWVESEPARVLRRTATKVQIEYLARKSPKNGGGWEKVETWVKADKIKPRTADEDFPAKNQHPEF